MKILTTAAMLAMMNYLTTSKNSPQQAAPWDRIHWPLILRSIPSINQFTG